ncbi:MAG: NAD(P)H-binding protein [Bacteroidota bacterium]
MTTQIKIAIIGGTGKSGKYLVKQLINQGIPFKMLLRNPDKFQSENPTIEVVKGDARDIEAIRTLIEGCGAILSTLGQPKGESSMTQPKISFR